MLGFELPHRQFLPFARFFVQCVESHTCVHTELWKYMLVSISDNGHDIQNCSVLDLGVLRPAFPCPLKSPRNSSVLTIVGAELPTFLLFFPPVPPPPSNSHQEASFPFRILKRAREHIGLVQPLIIYVISSSIFRWSRIGRLIAHSRFKKNVLAFPTQADMKPKFEIPGLSESCVFS